jgi:hypothetical protein
MDQNHRRKRDDEGNSLIQTSDGGYAIAGYTNPSAQEEPMSMSSSWMPMVTSNGPKPSAEKRLILATPSFRPPMAATPSPAHTTLSTTTKALDVYVVKLDANGNLQWTKTIGGEYFDWGGPSLIQTSDGGYAIAGATGSFGAGGLDVYVVKLDKNGNACCAVSQTSQVGSGGRLGSALPPP